MADVGQRDIGSASGGRPSIPDECPWLMIFRPGSCERFPLPGDGDVTLGSQAAATLRLDDPAVLPFHALIRLGPAEALLVPSEGAPPLLLNDQPVLAPRGLASGDAVTLGAVTLVFHDRSGRGTRRAVLEPGAFRTRLRQEVERCLRTRGALAVLAIRLGPADASEQRGAVDGVGARLRQVDVMGWDGGAEVLVLLPDTAESAGIPARRALEAVMARAPGAKAGIAMCPADANDVDGLLTGARNAASCAANGEVASVASAITRLEVAGGPLLAADPAMRRLLDLVGRLAASDLPVLVEGETGVGKEMVALALHQGSKRRDRPFLAINCAAVAEGLFESELFGHERGAFTGATATKRGLLETGEGGTVLLDEIGECPMHVQAKLLRVLETRRVARVGSVAERAIDVRIVTATNRDLEADVAAGRFRRDLYYRLVSARVTVPPLRDRPLDVAVLARAFLESFCAEKGRPPCAIHPDAMRRLALHDWPGNVRELRNLMGYCLATMEGDVLLPDHLPPGVARAAAPWLAVSASAAAGSSSQGSGFEPFDRRRHAHLADEVRELTRIRILQALAATGGVRVEAARLLGMPLRTLVTRLAQFGINPPGRPLPPGQD